MSDDAMSVDRSLIDRMREKIRKLAAAQKLLDIGVITHDEYLAVINEVRAESGPANRLHES